MSERTMAFTDEEIALVQNFFNENIIGKRGKSITAVDLHKKLSKKLSDEVDLGRFRGWLSKSVNEGKITGVKGKRRVGYVSADENSSPPGTFQPPPKVDSAPTAMPAAQPEPKIEDQTAQHSFVAPVDETLMRRRSRNRFKFAHHVWVDRRCYRVVGSWAPLEAIVHEVLGGKQGENGRITFNGKRYECNADLFEKIVTHVLAAFPEGESEPVLDTDDGIPAELMLSS